MAPPDVIFLNGSSSAGKSSLARALQTRLVDDYVCFSVDDPVQRAPLRLHDNPRGFRFEALPMGGVQLNLGPDAEALMAGWRRMLRTGVDAGLRLILDEVILSQAILGDWLHVFAGVDVFFVGVRCDLAELQRRERERGDRMVGQALWMHELVHAHGLYDLEVDSTTRSAHGLAEDVVEGFASRSGPGAFERLRASWPVCDAPPSP